MRARSAAVSIFSRSAKTEVEAPFISSLQGDDLGATRKTRAISSREKLPSYLSRECLEPEIDLAHSSPNSQFVMRLQEMNMDRHDMDMGMVVVVLTKTPGWRFEFFINDMIIFSHYGIDYSAIIPIRQLEPKKLSFDQKLYTISTQLCTAT